MGTSDDEALRRLEGDLDPTPDFAAMTSQERDEWLRSRPKHRRPAAVAPILTGLVLSVVWFMLLSPLVSAPWGPNLSATVIDRGQAKIQSCQRNWTTLWRMWECSATISWKGTTPTDLPVLSPRRLTGTTEVVARNKVRNSRSPSIVSTFGDRSVIVPADMPAHTGASVAMMTALNLGAVLVIWTACGSWAVRRTRRAARRG